MAVPKHKTSKQRANKRFANWKIASPSMSECSHCHEMKLTHRVCPVCGYYDEANKIDVKSDKK